MTTIVTRAGKGSPLTHTEVDTNFTNLNTNKLETAAIPLGTLAAPSISFVGDANTGAYSPGADTLAFVTAGSNRVHITSGGLVGIGTSSPAAGFGAGVVSLDVVGPIFARGPIAASQTNAGVFQYTGNDTTIRSYGATANTGAIAFNTGGGGGSADAERMRITAAGNVGIGVTSPSATLELSGTGTVFKANTATTTSTAISLQLGGLVTSSNSGCFIKSHVNLGSTLNSQLSFEVNGGALEAARIDSSGRLLIGTVTGNANGGILQLSSGITFPATPVATTDVNTLDDYEEGTWAPTDDSGAGLSFTVSNCRYTKIGRAVAIQGTITYPSTANANNAAFTSFPFAAADNITLSVIYTDASVASFTYLSSNTASSFLLTPGVNVTNVTMSGKSFTFAGVYAI